MLAKLSKRLCLQAGFLGFQHHRIASQSRLALSSHLASRCRATQLVSFGWNLQVKCPGLLHGSRTSLPLQSATMMRIDMTPSSMALGIRHKLDLTCDHVPLLGLQDIT